MDSTPAPAEAVKGLCIALVGAESTGKSSLALALTEHLSQTTRLRVTPVDEHLRHWCDAQGRTPRIDEQAGIAQVQIDLIEAAALRHDLVICDTTPLMTAVYSDLLFADTRLYDTARQFHRRCAQTLLMGLDLPWVADGLQRDGPHVRAPVDALLRQALRNFGTPFSVVTGQGPARLDAALNAITPVLLSLAPQDSGPGLFSRLVQRQAQVGGLRAWACEHCDVAECEHALRRRG
ncbi:MAG: ATP-binding protein [Paucibacter sp.]|nr:ATP-binding protein [Roseateles sp.]